MNEWSMNNILAIGIAVLLIMYVLWRIRVLYIKITNKMSFDAAIELIDLYGYKVYEYDLSGGDNTADIMEALKVLKKTPATIVVNAEGDLVGSLKRHTFRASNSSKQSGTKPDVGLHLVVDNVGQHNEIDSIE